MGSLYSCLVWGSNPDVPDPVSGLSLRDVYLVQESWKPVYNHKVANGTLIFRTLFETDAETKTFFSNLKGVQLDELDKSVKFKAHVINFMTSLNMVIVHLNEPDLVTAMMHKLGKSHNKRNIRKKHFKEFEEVLMNVLRDVLKVKESTLEAWDRTIKFMYMGIFEELLS